MKCDNSMKELKNDLIYKKRKLKYPCIYKHFKGKYYATMGLSRAVNCNDIENIYDAIKSSRNFPKCKLTAKHTEIDGDICIYMDLEGKFYHQKDEDSNNLVLYKALYDDTGMFARPVSMFLSKVDKEKYLNSTQEYRFEEFYK